MRTSLHVCVTCRQGRPLPDGQTPPGRHLHDAVRRAASDSRNAPAIHEVACLAACASGCTAALMSDGKWTVLLGRLDAGKAHDLIDLARLYDASPTGMVMPSRRAESLRDAVLARLPSANPEIPA